MTAVVFLKLSWNLLYGQVDTLPQNLSAGKSRFSSKDSDESGESDPTEENGSVSQVK